jgi:hypothetical protein
VGFGFFPLLAVSKQNCFGLILLNKVPIFSVSRGCGLRRHRLFDGSFSRRSQLGSAQGKVDLMLAACEKGGRASLFLLKVNYFS